MIAGGPDPRRRVHVATRAPIEKPGGLHGVVRGLSTAQNSIGLKPLVLDRLARNVNVDALLEAAPHSDSHEGLFGQLLLEFHFSQTVGDVLSHRPLRSVPRIMHFHGPWALEGRVQGNSRMRYLAKRFVESRAYREFEVFTADSSAFKSVLQDEFKVPDSQVRVIHPGIDVHAFSAGSKTDARERLGIPSGAFVFASLRRLEPRMGLDLLIRAVSQIPDAFLAIGGAGSSRESLEALGSELGIADRVRFLGRLPQESVADIYRAADAAVVPTRALEGFGLVVLEAFACGTPVIASNVGGLPEAMGPWAAEWTCPPEDVPALVDAMTRMMKAPPLGSDLIAHANSYSWESVARSVESYAIEAF